MSQPLAVLGKVEEEVSALLVAGLATQRSGRERLDDLATEASALKMERLAQEIRALASRQDPTALANSAFTTLAMARKLRERLIQWPEIKVDDSVALGDASIVRMSLSGPLSGDHDRATLVGWMESGNDLVRSRAADLLVARGQDAIPELARVATAGPTAVRREAIRALGRIGGDRSLEVLLGLPDVNSCWRSLVMAVLPYGQEAVLPLADVVRARPEKKLQEKRKVAAALLYRLGAFDILAPLANGEGEIIEVAFACAGGVRMGRWRDGQSPRKLGSRNWEASFYGRAMVSLSEAEATGKLDPLLDELEAGPADELKLFGRWGVTASPLEKVLAERFLERTDGGNAKSRARATSFLCGLAYPRLVPLLMNRLARNEIEAAQAINILGETGGSQAVGLLLDMLRRGITVLGTLGHVGDPATVPVLLKLLERSVAQGVSAPIGFDAGSIEYTLASLGDGIADQLAGEMRARQGTAMAASIQRTLLQMNGKRAKDALKGTDTESIQSLVSRLGRPNVSKAAIKALIRKGDEAVESVETVAAQGDYLAASDALRVLDGIGTGRATRAVQTTLEKRLSGLSAHYGNEASLCVEAVNIVSKRQGAGAISLLVRALGVNCGVVQNAAVDALVRIGVEVVPHVLPLLASPQASARASALGVVGRLRVAVAEEKVLELLADTDQRVRNAAAAALGEICKVTGNQRVADALGKALLAGAFAMPYPGIQALGQTGQRSAIPYLRKFLETNPGNSYYIDQAIKKIEATSPAGVSGFAGKLKGFFGGGR